jgi:RHS repeat-associated protein
VSVTSSSGTTNLTYDFESRVTQISGPGINASYSYNGLDTRVGKTENSVSNTFRRSGAYVTDPVLGDGTASYTPGVSRRQGTSVSYQHGGLKNLDAQTSVSQNVTAARIYDAFGNLVTSSGAWAGPFGYAGGFGYQQDASGLKLLGHRYYDPSTGRFLTRDPIKDGRNWYVYGAGEAAPTNIVDPAGLAKIWIAWRRVAGTEYYHALIIIKDETSGTIWVAEAGPAGRLRRSGAFGRVATVLAGGVRQITSGEEYTEIMGFDRTLVHDDDLPGATWVGRTKTAGRLREVPYYIPATGLFDPRSVSPFPRKRRTSDGNSNSWAREVLERLGLPPVWPEGNVPGWLHDPWTDK